MPKLGSKTVTKTRNKYGLLQHDECCIITLNRASRHKTKAPFPSLYIHMKTQSRQLLQCSKVETSKLKKNDVKVFKLLCLANHITDKQRNVFNDTTTMTTMK